MATARACRRSYSSCNSVRSPRPNLRTSQLMVDPCINRVKTTTPKAITCNLQLGARWSKSYRQAQRQGQGDSAAQAAPVHHMLPAQGDILAYPGQAVYDECTRRQHGQDGDSYALPGCD